MNRVLAATTTALALAVFTSATSASAGNLQLRVGGFFPRASGNLFVDDSDLYRTNSGDPVKTSDWAGWTGGIEFSQALDRNVELGFHVDGYGRELETSYNKYTRPSGGEIFQTLRFSEVPVGFTVRLIGGSRHSTVRPYIGVGGDVVFWKYEEEGSFIRFTDASLPIVDDFFRSSGAALGGHVAGGVRLALSHDIGVLAEGRYLVVGTKEMKDDFGANRIDLNGASANVGFYINF